jgi:hypothetical protein
MSKGECIYHLLFAFIEMENLTQDCSIGGSSMALLEVGMLKEKVGGFRWLSRMML